MQVYRTTVRTNKAVQKKNKTTAIAKPKKKETSSFKFINNHVWLDSLTQITYAHKLS